MDILPGYKLCRKGLHQYPSDKKQCSECQRETKRRWREKNLEKVREIQRKYYKRNHSQELKRKRLWREQNSEQAQEISKRYYEKNREHILNRNRRYYEQNYEESLERTKQWQKQNLSRHRVNCRNWAEKNRNKINAYASGRRAKKKQATPPWADHAAINAIYAEAVCLEQEAGVKHHVDHIYPLCSPYLCGLHIAENLQILTDAENLSKSNRTWPGQLDCQRLPLHLNGFTQDLEWADSQGVCTQEDLDW